MKPLKGAEYKKAGCLAAFSRFFLYSFFLTMKLQKASVNFTQVSNVILNDKCLSAKAKGVYCYLFSKPDNWDFSSERIANEFSDGEKSIRSALKELEDAGYLERQKL